MSETEPRPAAPYAWTESDQWWYDDGQRIERAGDCGEAWLHALVPHIERMVRYHLIGYSDLVITEAISFVYEQLWQKCANLPKSKTNLRSYLLAFISWRARDSRDYTVRRDERSIDQVLRYARDEAHQSTSLSDSIAHPADEIETMLHDIQLTALLHTIPEEGNLRKIAFLLSEGHSLRGIGRHLGLAPATMHRIIHNQLAGIITQFYAS